MLYLMIKQYEAKHAELERQYGAGDLLSFWYEEVSMVILYHVVHFGSYLAFS